LSIENFVLYSNYFSTQSRTMRKVYSNVIIGGSVVGSSIAYHLAAAGVKNILVVERDPGYKIASAVLSAGGIRQQFSLPENIDLSMYGIGMIKNPEKLAVEDHVPCYQFRENGYLFLAGEDQKHILEANNRTQHNAGADWITLMTPDKLKEKFPWLNTDGIALGSYGTKNEGYFDPWSLLNAFKSKSISLGVEYMKGEAMDVDMTQEADGSPGIDAISVMQVGDNGAQLQSIKGENYINAAGAWSAGIIAAAAANTSNPNAIFKLPVERRKRAVFCVKTALNDETEAAEGRIIPTNSPLTVSPNGVYFRSESTVLGKYICGVSPLAENDGPSTMDSELQCTDHELFDDQVWPTLYDQVPAFDRLKVESFWSGFYDYNSFDQNMIIGRHPEIKNLIVCTGMSGHGLQQSPGAGRAVMELITEGKFVTSDLTRFGFQRLIDNKPLFEVGIV
jgi:FAD-dependent oxidoreductase domain-containing protein 1